MSPLFNDLPKAGTFPHEEWTKIDDLKLNKPRDKPFLVESAEPANEDEKEEKNDEKDEKEDEKEKLPIIPGAGTFTTASQPRQKKPDKVNRRENARFGQWFLLNYYT